MQAQRNLAAAKLTLDVAACRVCCGETVVKLTLISFAWLAWFARRALEGLPPLHWKLAGSMEVEAFLTEHKAALNDPLADDQHPTIAARRKEGISKAFFEERNSKLKRELKRVLGESAAARYSPQRRETRRLAGCALALEPHHIQFASLKEGRAGKLAETACLVKTQLP